MATKIYINDIIFMSLNAPGWRIVWSPEGSVFSIEKWDAFHMFWVEYSVRTHDSIHSDFQKAYGYAKELLAKAVDGEIEDDR